MRELSNVNIGLIYGTDTNNTEEIGERISTVLQSHGCTVEIINVTEASADTLNDFGFLIMGIPTWDFGGIQEDWEDFEEVLLASDLTNKTVALYGLGDQFGYGDYFVDAMGWLHKHVVNIGGNVIGSWSTDGYEFEESLAANEDKTMFVGLAIDEDQQFELTDTRIAGWVEQILSEYSETVNLVA
ncbi:flavodoxin [Alkalimarinus alittae]|uniref:Flavodoxin n=1 Tax=Alkalimarinus alittae TaxID=2961619 RepID=A0ABY6N4N7_9ALTE|nr:flavodoxin [Alkalimarinus alittae]UZE97085.1 flavodoxin [Alkalimarinus alittae]